MRSWFIAGRTVIAYVEAEGIDASGARVARATSKDAGTGRWGTYSDSASWEEVFHFD